MEETEGFQELKNKTINTLCNITALNRLHELKVYCSEELTDSPYYALYEEGYNKALSHVKEKINSIITDLKQE